MFAAHAGKGAIAANNPSTIFGANLLFWLDASNTSSLTLSGASVTQWDDVSGNGLNAAQASATEKPQYSATALNSKPGVTFDGASDYLSLSSVASFPTGTSASTLIAITSLSSVGSYPQLFCYGKAAAEKARCLAGVGSNGFVGVSWYADDHDTATTWLTTQRLVIAQFQNSTADVSIDGGASSTLTATGTPSLDASGNSGTIGVNPALAGPGNFIVQEMLVVSGTVTAGQITAMQAYRAAKW